MRELITRLDTLGDEADACVDRRTGEIVSATVRPLGSPRPEPGDLVALPSRRDLRQQLIGSVPDPAQRARIELAMEDADPARFKSVAWKLGLRAAWYRLLARTAVELLEAHGIPYRRSLSASQLLAELSTVLGTEVPEALCSLLPPAPRIRGDRELVRSAVVSIARALAALDPEQREQARRIGRELGMHHYFLHGTWSDEDARAPTPSDELLRELLLTDLAFEWHDSRDDFPFLVDLFESYAADGFRADEEFLQEAESLVSPELAWLLFEYRRMPPDEPR